MALQSSGAISINDIAIEFGCAKDMLSCANAAGLSTTNISLSSFYGLSAYTPPSIVVTPSQIDLFSPTSDTVYFEANASASNGSGSYSYNWAVTGGATIHNGQGTTLLVVKFNTPSNTGSSNGTITCTVTDGTGSTASDSSTWAVAYEGGGGGGGFN